MRKKLALILCMLLAGAGMLTGCSVGAPGSASALLERSRSKSPDNYHIKGEVTTDISATAAGYSLEFPMGMDMDLDVNGGNEYGTVSVKMTLTGQEIDETAEVYVVNEEEGALVYSRTKNSEWTKSSRAEATDITGMGTALLDNASFDEAEFEYDKEAGTYKVTTKMGTLLANEEYRKALEEYYATAFGTLNMTDEKIGDMIDSMADAEITYIFEDKGYTLTNANVSDLVYETSMESSGIPITMSVKQNMNFDFSEYGNITPEEVAVPEDVVSSAVEQ